MSGTQGADTADTVLAAETEAAVDEDAAPWPQGNSDAIFFCLSDVLPVASLRQHFEKYGTVKAVSLHVEDRRCAPLLPAFTRSTLFHHRTIATIVALSGHCSFTGSHSCTGGSGFASGAAKFSVALHRWGAVTFATTAVADAARSKLGSDPLCGCTFRCLPK